MINRLKASYQKHERWIPIAFFLLGFVADILMISRIDDPVGLTQQAIYLVLCGLLLATELIEETREIHPSRILARVWKHREALLHFLLGSLLNSYAIFYFKSASALTSLLFIAILIALLTLNEFKRFGKSQTQVHAAFVSLCLISFLICLAPMALGFMGLVPFLVAVAASCLVVWLFHRQLKPRMRRPEILRTHLLFPFAAIQGIFILLYFLDAIPPVPLSVKYMGIYHAIEKTPAGYELTYTRPWWKFWQKGDQTFLARPGDRVYCYAQIFSPTRFKDQLQIRWLYHDPKRGWQSADAIPIPVLGGRDEGYRTVTFKNNYQPGTWRVQVETRDNREIGRIGFEIVMDESQDARETSKEIR